MNSKTLLGRMNSNFEGVHSLSDEEHIFYLFATNREDAKIIVQDLLNLYSYRQRTHYYWCFYVIETRLEARNEGEVKWNSPQSLL